MADTNSCTIQPVGRRRDGGTRYWCLEHKADATAKFGKQAECCRYAHVSPVLPSQELTLCLSDYPGGIGLWGAVPAVYDTSMAPLDRGIHVHARKSPKDEKCIDETFRKVNLKIATSDSSNFEVFELDAIYYMVSSVFGFHMKEVRCTYCSYSHLDRDWFSLHPHQRHLCSGCGNYFRDSEVGIGNPVVGVQKQLGHAPTQAINVNRELEINQRDFPGGVQIWGSNPSVFWNCDWPEEIGIHVHAYRSDGPPEIDNTYSRVVIDGIEIDAEQVRVLMAQKIIPHLAERITNLRCAECSSPHFSKGPLGYTPSEIHICEHCGAQFRSKGRKRKLISNPLLTQFEHLTANAPRPPRTFDLGLLPETI
jgi:hypothetical protein